MKAIQSRVLRLLDYVVKRVVDAARQIRREQHPAVRGTFDGEFRWPVLSPGRCTARHFLISASRSLRPRLQPRRLWVSASRDRGLGRRHSAAKSVAARCHQRIWHSSRRACRGLCAHVIGQDDARRACCRSRRSRQAKGTLPHAAEGPGQRQASAVSARLWTLRHPHD